jgi:hypothetical protein
MPYAQYQKAVYERLESESRLTQDPHLPVPKHGTVDSAVRAAQFDSTVLLASAFEQKNAIHY